MDNWQITQNVDLAQPQTRIYSQGWGKTGDRNAHQWTVNVFRNGQAEDITEATVAIFCLREDKRTVVIKGAGTGNTATATLTQECYAVPGVVKCVMRISRNNQTITATFLYIVVEELIPGEFIDPGNAVPNLEDLFTIAQVVLDAAEAANTAAGYANTQGDYAKVQGDFAHAQGSYAQAQGDYAKEQADRAKGALDLAYDENAVLILKEQVDEVRDVADSARETSDALAASFTAEGNFFLNAQFTIWSRGYIDVVNPDQGALLAERWKAFNPNNVPLYVVKHSNEHGLGGGITIQNTATGSGFGFYQTVETRYSELSGKEVTVTVFTSAGGLLETCQVAVGSVHSNLTRVAYDSEKVIFRGMIPAVLSSFVAFYFITGSNVAPSTFIVYGVTGTIGGAMMRLSTPNLTRDWQDCARYYLSVKNFMAHCFYPYSLDGPTFPVPMYKVPTILSYAINTPGQAPDTLIQGNWLITDQRIVYVNLVRQIQPYTSGFYSNYELSADL